MIFFFFLLKIRGSQHLGPPFQKSEDWGGGLERERNIACKLGFTESHASSHV